MSTRQLLAGRGIERFELEHQGVVTRELRSPVCGELGTRGREQRERSPPQPREQTLHELQHHVVGPVEVGECQHQWLIGSERVEACEDGAFRLVARA
jgi:hypothetical protein